MKNLFSMPGLQFSFFSKPLPNAWVSLSLALALVSCLPSDNQTIQPTGPEPEPLSLIARDTLTTGTYLSFTIGETAAATYTSFTGLQEPILVNYLNMVSNIFSGMDGMEDKLALYHTILLDEKRGTDAGVQITIEKGLVKSLYLNSGKMLQKWPVDFKSSAIRIGDKADILYGKLKGISSHKSYRNKFESVNLITKDLARDYDPGMADSPQWYFAYTKDDDKMEVVKLNMNAGLLTSIIVEQYQK